MKSTNAMVIDSLFVVFGKRIYLLNIKVIIIKYLSVDLVKIIMAM